ncbi:hypothetical protein [Mycobacterium sp. RTGN5]|uniref:hypothetical protein n=1 Tax=Mycobacterium sp. RTGN5 TaxID=3016522 RepID=UPI0029C8659F|nr:hypothetical protein [Mycobacterium sp. RTGN5]
MKKYLACGIGGAAALMTAFGPGSAGAINDYYGMTYAKALEKAGQYGQTLMIATKTGSYLAIDECIVVGSRRAEFLDSSGRKPGGSNYLVDLNCNDLSALNGHPGNSAASPEGKKVLDAKIQATSMNKDFAKKTAAGETPACFSTDAATRWCVKICTTSKSCSSELNQALGL